MTHIALGYDGSPGARTALDWVAVRAARENARVDLITVTNMVTSNYENTERELARAERLLLDLAPGVHVESHRIDGTMPNALLKDARTSDLLVIGLHQQRPLRNALKGWMPQRLSARAHGPVALIPEGWSLVDGPVVVGVDDDPSSDEALMFAAAEAQSTHTTLRMVHAWSMPVPRLEGSSALLASPLQVKENHRRILREAMHRVQEAYPTVTIEEALVNDNPPAALLHRSTDASIAVIGTHRRGVMAGGFFGSVAQDILGQIGCPVAIVPND
ncbi:universal stress protein [Microbacterium thalassium]|uniref:Nucleotide-binding universal stress UspA family protein n=1 Tax=Microbacterium thalassium TaxID=362649 RepID=A0A7X0KT88_9MICO|nr:universal stress protein [Microbacterium thalassium]MBB6389866.1 nucleotide-binding universal stress UspA family protein [Microbacterium thalassium]GLK24553.1 hypothetical protein GCM10017607_18710 [Microbacterium thalassium]